MLIRPELREAVLSSCLLIGTLLLLLFRFGAPRRAAAVLLVTLIIDQLTQAMVARYFLLTEGPVRRIPLLHGWMMISYAENWQLGFGRSGQDLLLLTLLMVVCLIVLYVRLARYHYRMALLTELACALLIAGLLGILIDRVRIGYVVDFVRFFYGQSMMCNVADLSALLAGSLMLIRGVLLVVNKITGTISHPSPPKVRPSDELRTVSVMILVTTMLLASIWSVWPV